GTIDVNATNSFTNTETGNLIAKENVTVTAPIVNNNGNAASKDGYICINGNCVKPAQDKGEKAPMLPPSQPSIPEMKEMKDE
ncbi:hypothetical protein, partial [Ursidibacter arcticus]|uniref:hypothetical protein n=1 Tax=Ursidibacter arcticus TaxID=1524965 RepID=UPI0012FBBDCC